MARRLNDVIGKSGNPPGKRRLVGRPYVVFFAYAKCLSFRAPLLFVLMALSCCLHMHLRTFASCGQHKQRRYLPSRFSVVSALLRNSMSQSATSATKANRPCLPGMTNVLSVSELLLMALRKVSVLRNPSRLARSAPPTTCPYCSTSDRCNRSINSVSLLVVMHQIFREFPVLHHFT